MNIKQGDLLMAAFNVLNNERQEERGDMLPNYERVAQTMTAITGREFSVTDVLLTMVMIKLVRELKRPNLDNSIDAVAYIDGLGRARHIS